MPGYIIHQLEADIIKKKLLERDVFGTYTEEWQKEFQWGCLIPDAAEKGKTHFWNQKEPCYLKLPDLEQFIEKYGQDIRRKKKNPVLFGYYAHLCLDRLFWEVYIKENTKLLDSAGYETNSYSNIRFFEAKKLDGKIPVNTFVEYLHEDYTKLNHYFIEKYQLVIPDENIEIRDSDKPEIARNLSIRKITEQLKEFLDNQSTDDSKSLVDDLKIIEIKSFEKFLELAAETIICKPEYLRITDMKMRISMLKNGRIIKRLLYPFVALRKSGIYAVFIGVLSIVAGIIAGEKGISQLKKSGLIQNHKNGKSNLNTSDLIECKKEEKYPILEKWIKKWEQTANAEESDFAQFVKKVYRDVYSRYEKNKNKNFIFKYLFIGIMIIALSGFGIFCAYNIYNGGKIPYIIAENSFFLVMLILALTIISKWLDIKKYQETWVRHYYHLYLLNREMQLYLYGLEEYSADGKKTEKNINRIFMKRFFDIEDKNTNKFVDNMEKKEVRLGDGIKDILGK